MSVFLLFALATCVGVLSTLFWIPEDDLGRGYFQMNALVLLGLMALAVTVVALHPFDAFGQNAATGRIALGICFASCFLYYAAIWRERWELCRAPAAVALIAGSAALLLVGLKAFDLETPLPHAELLRGIALLTSALLLGWSLIAMLLGHWYLVAPKLPFHHLVLFCQVLVVASLLRLAAVGATLAFAATVPDMVEPHPIRVLTTLNGQGMFFWFRVLWGLAVPTVLAGLSLHCAKQRSNQSATGILYVVVVGTFIGEITAYYLAVTTGVPA